MASEKRPAEAQTTDDGSEQYGTPKKRRKNYKEIRSMIADGSLLGFPQIWPGGQKHWELGLNFQQKRLVFKALDEPISRGSILEQVGERRKWTWEARSKELTIVMSLCEEWAAAFFREEEEERQRQHAEETHKQSIIAARLHSQKMQAAWALKHRSMLKILGADLQWCEREVRMGEDSLDNEECIVDQPAEVTRTLRSYQLEGVQWLAQTQAKGMSVILGDEMGLGKTLQTIAYLAHLKFDRSIDGPHLILCPLSVLDHWKEEFMRCCPALRVLILPAGHRAALEQLADGYPNGYDAVVTTYGGVHSVSARGFFVDTWWRTLVLDEGHCIKNPKADLSNFLRRLHFVQGLILTGTPLQNDLVELWALLNFLYPKLFPRQEVFRTAFSLDPRKSIHGKPCADKKSLRHIHDFLKVCMLRRMKSNVEVDVPPKVETTIMCPLSHNQRLVYARLLLVHSNLFKELNKAAAKVGEAQQIRGHAWRKLQFLLMQLRQVCIHPYFLPGADPTGAKNIEESLLREHDLSFVQASGKLSVLDRLLQRLLAAGHRCTIFSQFKRALNVIEKLLQLRGVEFCRLDGSTPRDQRGKVIGDFNAVEALVNVFLLTTRAGGLGINLQTADTCILFDSDWNPHMDLQAMARVHRIGQARRVHVYRLVAEGTVEERIVSRAQKKLCLDSIVNNSSERGDHIHMSAEEWFQAVQLESSAVVSSGVSKSLSDQELDAIIDRSRQADTSVRGIIDGGKIHTGADVVEGRVAVEKNTEEHRREVVGQVKKSLAEIASAPARSSAHSILV